MEQTLTAARLREVLHYDPATGVFIRRIATSNSVQVGDVVGSPHSRGYLEASVDGHSCLLHRLVWLYMTGAWPDDGIDHRDGDKRNNRWLNLRDATQQLNAENVRVARAHNRTGVLGVTRLPSGRFRASIGVNRRLKHLGVFDSTAEASCVYLAAKRRLHAGCTL